MRACFIVALAACTSTGPVFDQLPAPVEVGAGASHGCVLYDDGRVFCWGGNDAGQVGTDGGVIPSPVAVEDLDGAAHLAVGGRFTCATLSSGEVRCWGSNDNGQLGNPEATGGALPVPVEGILGAIAVEAGEAHACVVLEAGGVRCWGNNMFGQLGSGSDDPTSGTAVTTQIGGAHSIVAGPVHTCAVLDDRTASCWGFNEQGQLGDGTVEQASTPVAVRDAGGDAFLSDVMSVAVGGSHWAEPRGHTCAVVGDPGALFCWGDNDQGAVGSPEPGVHLRPTLLDEESVSNVVQVAAGADHTCAVTTDGSLLCWGANDSGQLGSGGGSSPIPAPVDLPAAAAVAAGRAHTCAILTSGEVRCWGANGVGQLGDGSTEPSSSPVTVQLPE